jgi:hypothetical protein
MDQLRSQAGIARLTTNVIEELNGSRIVEDQVDGVGDPKLDGQVGIQVYVLQIS